jgi:amidase
MLLIADLNAQRPLLDLVMSDDATSVLDAMIGNYPAPTIQSASDLQAARFKVMREWSAFFQEHPVLLSPTWALPAFEHGADLETDQVADILGDTLRPVLPGNLLGIPAAVVPCGTAAGLPVGVQVMGDKYTDLRCLAVAQQIQDAEGVHTPIDPVTA